MLFGKGVDGTDFLAGFAAVGINAFTVFTVRSAGRDEELLIGNVVELVLMKIPQI